MRFTTAVAVLAMSVLAAAAPVAAASAPRPAPAGRASPPAEEIRATLAGAVQRFQALDAPGVLRYVSDDYRSGPITKAVIREQLATTFELYDAMAARVSIDEVRVTGDTAVVVTTGTVTGRLRLVGAWTPLLSWTREPEIVRRERGVWRAYGDHAPAGAAAVGK